MFRLLLLLLAGRLQAQTLSARVPPRLNLPALAPLTERLSRSLPLELRPALEPIRLAAPEAAAVPQPAAPPVAVLPQVRTGDLVFLDLDCGALCDAMAEATAEQFGADGPRLHHVGVVEVQDGEPFVWEAWPGRGVGRVRLQDFLGRVKAGEGQPGGFYLGRMGESSQALVEPALARIRALSGSPYDEGFSWDGPGLYCSKLVALAYGDLFAPRPMTFGREGSPARRFWTAYFEVRGMAVPDGLPGVSPLGLYLDLRAVSGR